MIDMETSLNTKLQILHFKLLHVRACMEIQYINKVLPLMQLEAIPMSPAYVAGLMNIAGKSIPVIDLAMMLGMKRRNSYSLDVPVLLCSQGTEEIALIVDSVHELATISEAEFQMREEFSHPTSPFLATITIGNELSLLLDMKKIFEFCLSLHDSKDNFRIDLPNLESYLNE